MVLKALAAMEAGREAEGREEVMVAAVMEAARAAEAATDDGAPAWPAPAAPAAPAVVSTFLRFLTHDGAACADAGASLRTPVAGAAAATSESVVSSATDRHELRALRGFSATAKATERRRLATILHIHHILAVVLEDPIHTHGGEGRDLVWHLVRGRHFFVGFWVCQKLRIH